MKEQLKLRKADSKDLLSLSALINSAYRGDSSRIGWTTEADFLAGQRTDPISLRDLLETMDSVILVGELKSESESILSSVHLKKINSEICYLGMLCVHPEYQDRGWGKLVMKEAELYVKNQFHCRYIEISVIQIRTELIQWYERIGFIKTGEVKDFPYGNEKFGIPLRSDLQMLIMRKFIV